MSDGEVKNPGDEVPAGTPQSGELPCRLCQGTGKVDGEACAACAGTGLTTVLVGDA